MIRALKCLLTMCLVLAITVSAFAEDVVVLKNGKTYKGEVLEETKDIIRMKVDVSGIVQTYVFWKDDVQSLSRDADVEKGNAEARTPRANVAKSDSKTDETAAKEADLVNKKVFVIPMHGGVGETFRQDKLEEAIKAARPFKPDVIVLEINSPGGALSEVYKLRDYISEARDEFRIVVWIKSAISAAAMTSMMCREMYFMKEGHIGAATAWRMTSGGAQAMTGPALEKWVQDAKDFSQAAGYDPLVTQAMIDPKYVLSADVEELPDGERRVTFYDHLKDGAEVVCREGEILTLTASQALRYNLSLGTVDDKEEFARMLNLSGWVEVSDAGRKIMEDWISTYDLSQVEIPRLLREYGNPASTLDDRIRVVRELSKWVRRAPQIAEFYPMPNGGGPLDLRDLDRLLKQLVRQRG
jgi:ATP-dependent protease ClpP protease subunit